MENEGGGCSLALSRFLPERWWALFEGPLRCDRWLAQLPLVFASSVPTLFDDGPISDLKRRETPTSPG